MRRVIALAGILALFAAATLPALAAEGTDRKLEGWIVCECCGARNANPDGKECTLACHKDGKSLVLYSGGRLYKLSDQKAALQHVGYEVVVKGTLAKDGTLRVTAIEKAEKKV